MIIKDMPVDWDWVTRSLEARERIDPSSAEAIRQTVTSSIGLARRLASPSAILAKIPIMSIDSGSIELKDALKISGKALANHMKGAENIYLFLVTIGRQLEDEASSLMNSGDGLSGYILDRIGSFAAESLAEGIENRLRAEYAPIGKSVSMRFSPGYCDWPVEEQVKLDAILGFSGINVRLNESCMMIPKKSISGLIGIGPAELFSERRSQCSVCSMKSCGYRRI